MVPEHSEGTTDGLSSRATYIEAIVVQTYTYNITGIVNPSINFVMAFTYVHVAATYMHINSNVATSYILL